MKRTVILTLLLPLWICAAAEESYQYAKKTNPGELCGQAERRLPRSVPGLKRLDKILSETVRPDSDYCPDKSKCEIREIAFPGLDVSVLVKKATKSASILTLTISDSKWKTLQPLTVGAKLSVAEEYFGVQADPTSSPLRVSGDCAPIDIHHANGRVTKLRLDCQACM